jgi:membrane protein implicated in regulation of membrane protease activity
MGTPAVTFLVIGTCALVILGLSLVGHGGRMRIGRLHIGHVRLGRLRLGHSPPVGARHGGWDLSLPVLAGFVGAFGFVGAIVASVLPATGATTWAVAAAAGLVAAVPTGWATGRLVRAAMNLRTDATLTSGDLVGALGVVISPVSVGAYGEVRLAVAGTQLKLHARADEPLPLGTQIFVISVLTPTSVLVEATPRVD